MARTMRFTFLLMAFLAAGPMAAFADPCEGQLPSPGVRFEGAVRYVGDGDSLCVGNTADPKTWVEVRVADFYAPELHAPGGEAAKRTLQNLAMGRSIQCVAGKRSYDRVVALCSINGSSVGDMMRRSGITEGGRGR